MWLNLLTSGEAVAAPSAARKRDTGVEGEVRTYGAGRQRSITTAGRRTTMAFTLRRVTTAQTARLEEWIGQPVMYRDYRGQRYVGAYYGLDVTEYKNEPDLYDVALTLHEVTWVEGA
ncbi:hypothetical protein [Micromonospora profundi]|uniref:hypothetical protein n=1 Tax=Micromonospora profundi TaxID=1420889 RepID=UPI00366520FF